MTIQIAYNQGKIWWLSSACNNSVWGGMIWSNNSVTSYLPQEPVVITDHSAPQCRNLYKTNHLLFALFWLLLYLCLPLADHALCPLAWHHERACCWDHQQPCVRPYLHLGHDQDAYLVLQMDGPLTGYNHHSFWQLGEEQAWRAYSLKSWEQV